MDQPEDRGFRRIGSLTQPIASSPKGSAFARMPCLPSSEISGSPSPEREPGSSIGRERSAIDVASLPPANRVLQAALAPPNSVTTPPAESCSISRCKAMIEQTETSLRCATTREIVGQLGILEAVYGAPAGWEQSAKIYVRLLSHLPIDLLAEAVERHVRTSKWFPKPAELLEGTGEEIIARRETLRWQSEKISELKAPATRRVTAEEIAELKAQHGFARQVIPRVRPTPLYVVNVLPETIAGEPWRE